MAIHAGSVKAANRKFFSFAAKAYNTHDPRRQASHAWLYRRLEHLAQNLALEFPQEPLSLLDAGCGTGLVLDLAKPLFARRIGADLSPEMLALLQDESVEKITTELEQLPLPDQSLHCIVAFATLHHLFAPEHFFAEAWRVLKPGGVLYTDHDIEAAFVKRYALPLRLYRSCFDHWQGFVKAHAELKSEDYHLSEFHGGCGLDGETLQKSLQQLGFTPIECEFHWQGMGPWDKAATYLGNMSKGRGRAPLLRLIARKGKCTPAR